jgi:hypothetical protein
LWCTAFIESWLMEIGSMPKDRQNDVSANKSLPLDLMIVLGIHACNRRP